MSRHHSTGLGRRLNRVRSFVCGSLIASSGLATLSAFSAEPTAQELDFFENKIRPVLSEKCYSCHSAEAEKSKGGLFLDTRAGLLAGGDTGAALVPGEPENSLIVEAIKRLDEDSAMPPKEENKLTESEIADFEKWIRIGAPDPRTGAKALTQIEKLMEQGKTHWAFQAVTKPALPEVKASDRVGTEVDRFILARLEAEGLSLSEPANPRALLRRLYFDLIGLPPTIEQNADFEKASATDAEAAYRKVVDELLASPHYGERWGRHWLDVARYADNMGAIFNGDDSYPNAHTYRDYVIRAFNEDKPYDQFLIEQLAADHLELSKDDNRSLAAMGFLTLGRKPNRRLDDDVRDDQIDAISRGLLGLTVGCARCHDHKLEPIPTTDYYSLYGILRSSDEPVVQPEIKPLPETPELADYREKNQVARTEFIRVHAFEAAQAFALHWSRVGDYLLSAHDSGFTNQYENDGKTKKAILIPRNQHAFFHDGLVRNWKEQVEAHPEIFGPWLEFAALPEAEFTGKAPELAKKFVQNADKKLDPNVAGAFRDIEITSMRDVAWAYNRIFQAVDEQWGEKFRGELNRRLEPKEEELGLPAKELAHTAMDRLTESYAAAKLPEKESLAKLADWLHGEKSVFMTNGFEIERQKILGRDVAAGNRRDAATAVTKLMTEHPGAPPRAMTMTDAEKLYDARVFVRGNASSLGAPAPRQFFEILAGPDQKPFPAETSGRLEFAKAVADPKNPLTARVIVNRVWQWHFGEGIVRTPSDFGFRGDPPTHPELLDYLAAKFVEEGWSFKKLHRELLLSSTYRQSSAPTEAAWERKDPDNKLWRRMNPRALEFEAFRDSLLRVADRLDLTVGGKSEKITEDAKAVRRTVYAHVDRKMLPNLFRSFNFPDPTFTAPQRKRSSLTPESLFLMNSPFIVENARQLSVSARKAGEKTADGVRQLYRDIFQRDPAEAELARAVAFLDTYPESDRVVPEADDWSYGFGKFDDATGKVMEFTSIKTFSGDKIKGSKQGDMDLSAMEITAEGGTVSEARATIRRWTAPFEGTVSIYAELLHSNVTETTDGKPAPKPEGDGVTCHVVSSSGGKLGTWQAFNSATMTSLADIKVKPGDTLDFVTLCGDDPKGDTFSWAPTITMGDRDIPEIAGIAMRWDARTNFMNPAKMPEPLGPWEELAQVLLLSNEFAQVD